MNVRQSNTWFRDHWLQQQHQEQETFDGDDDEDVVNLLPDSFDLGLVDELSILEAEFEAAAYHQTVGAEELVSGFQKKEKLKPGLEIDAEAVIRSLNLKSPKNGGVRPVMEPGKHREKPLQCVSPKCSPRRIIHQPR
ncbi:putative protein EARLY RESPONSIVE TO DEHYDRATION 15 [Cocos nucifera]|nr:putative protein EARLY RESPONSIVE TO DEHYDRATION 15 [Cocos nucifera]